MREALSAWVGLNIHKGKSKVLKVSAASTSPIILEGEALEEVEEEFTNLSSTVNKQGGADAHVRVRTGKTRVAFHQLKNMWASSNLAITTKIRMFNTTVKSGLLYGADTWRTTVPSVEPRHSLTPACVESSTSASQPPSATKNCGSEQNNNHDGQDGQDILYTNQPQTPKDNHSSGARKEKETDRCQEDGLHLGTAGEFGSGSEYLENPC